MLSLGQSISDGSVSLTLILEAPQRTIAQGWLTLVVTYFHSLTHIHTYTHNTTRTHNTTHTHNTICLGSVSLILMPLSELLPCFTPNTCGLAHVHRSHASGSHTHTCPQQGTSDHSNRSPSFLLSPLPLPSSSALSLAPGFSLSQPSSKGIMRNMEMCSVKLPVTNSPSPPVLLSHSICLPFSPSPCLLLASSPPSSPISPLFTSLISESSPCLTF